jgi:hypothetical protein
VDAVNCFSAQLGIVVTNVTHDKPVALEDIDATAATVLRQQRQRRARGIAIVRVDAEVDHRHRAVRLKKEELIFVHEQTLERV